MPRYAGLCITEYKPIKAAHAATVATPWKVKEHGNFKVMETLTLWKGLIQLEVWKESGSFWYQIEGAAVIHGKHPYPNIVEAKMAAMTRAKKLFGKMITDLELTCESIIPF